MNAEFNWWLLIVGLVIGGGLTWLVLLDSRRREDEVSARERAGEAVWLADALAAEGTPVPSALTQRVLQLHAEYLATSMPGEVDGQPASTFAVAALPARAPDTGDPPEAEPAQAPVTSVVPPDPPSAPDTHH